jgi:hypothetical protein
MDGQTSLIPMERIERAILSIRGEKVMLDSDLAELYGVETKVLNQAVKRNVSRFPEDFMFQLTAIEVFKLNRSQIVTGSQKHRDPRFPPYAFTEHGALMLAIKQAFPDATYTVRHAVGIDASDLFVARTGIRGSNDLVWVGRAANVAAKMCGLRHGGNFVYITKEVLDKLNDSVKYSSGTPKQWMWESFPWDGQTIYRSSWVWSAD